MGRRQDAAQEASMVDKEKVNMSDVFYPYRIRRRAPLKLAEDTRGEATGLTCPSVTRVTMSPRP